MICHDSGGVLKRSESNEVCVEEESNQEGGPVDYDYGADQSVIWNF